MVEDIIKTCYHCGEECLDELIEVESKNFCCVGCKTVFEILTAQGLDDYYQISTAPGTKNKSRKSLNYEYLDHKDLLAELLDFADESKSRITLFIPQIHCSSCIWLLEHIGKISPGIVQSRVNYAKKEVSFLFEHHIISLRQLVELLAQLGYDPIVNHKIGKKNTKITSNLSLKIGVAGFCFGNIMLLSFPEYLDVNEDFAQNYGDYFGYVNLILTLPVLFYAATDYFKSAWQGVKNKFINIDVPIVVGIIALFVKSVSDIVLQTGQGYFDSLAGLIFFLLIGKWYQSKSYTALSFDKDFTSYFPLTAVVLKENEAEETVLINKIKKNDLLKIRNQEIIPTDAILKSETAEIDYSFVTGESVPVLKKQGDKIFAGGKLIGGNVLVKTIKEVSQSYLTQLWQSREDKQQSKSQLLPLLDLVSKYFSIVILSLALLTIGYWSVFDSSKMIDAFISILIIACPCALALTVPFGLGGGIRVLGKQGLFLKNAGIIEKITKIDCIVFDKTGTLTESEAYSITFEGKDLSTKELQLVKSLVENSMHPYSLAIYRHIKAKCLKVSNFNEIVGQGIEGMVNGHFLKIGSFNFVSASNGDREHKEESSVHFSINNDYRGSFKIKKKLRAGLERLFLALGQKYELHLISGDNETDLSIFKNLFKTTQGEIKFKMTPTDKLHYVKQLQLKNRRVMMVGDGLNDAGALMQSDVGIAVNENTQGFSPACEGILLGSNLFQLDRYLNYAKNNLRIIKWSIGLSFLYNVCGLFFAAQALISPLFAAILMPLSSVTVVLAVSLGAKFSWKSGAK